MMDRAKGILSENQQRRPALSNLLMKDQRPQPRITLTKSKSEEWLTAKPKPQRNSSNPVVLPEQALATALSISRLTPEARKVVKQLGKVDPRISRSSTYSGGVDLTFQQLVYDVRSTEGSPPTAVTKPHSVQSNYKKVPAKAEASLPQASPAKVARRTRSQSTVRIPMGKTVLPALCVVCGKAGRKHGQMGLRTADTDGDSRWWTEEMDE